MPKKPLPQFVAPMQASSVKEPFDSADWIFETKLDGYRAIAVIDSTGKARIWSRNRLPLEKKFPTVRGTTEEMSLRSTILDGEIVALDEEGIPRFQLLQKWQKRPTAPIVYVLIDPRRGNKDQTDRRGVKSTRSLNPPVGPGANYASSHAICSGSGCGESLFQVEAPRRINSRVQSEQGLDFR